MSATSYARSADTEIELAHNMNPLHVNQDPKHSWANIINDEFVWDEKAKDYILDKSAFDLRNEFVGRVATGQRQKDAYVLSPDEITSIRTKIMSILRWKAKSDFLIDTANIGAGMLKTEYYTGNDVTKPRVTRSFLGGYNVVATKSSGTVELYGLDYDISIDKVSLDAGNSTANKVHLQLSLQAFETQILMESLVQYREWWIHRGSSSPNMVDIGVKGICNWTGITDPGALGLGADDHLDAAGDIDDSAMTMATSLIEAKFEPPFELHLTPKIYARAHKNKNATTGKRDIQFIEELIDKETGSKMFSGVHLNPYLINSATETTTTGAMLCMKKLPTDQNYVAESYGLGVYPLQTGSLGWDAKMLWLGGTVLQRPTAVCYRGSLHLV